MANCRKLNLIIFILLFMNKQLSGEDTETYIKAFHSTLKGVKIGTDILSAIPGPVRTASKVISFGIRVVDLLLPWISDSIWPDDGEIMYAKIRHLALKDIRDEIDGAFTKKANRKLLVFANQIAEIMNDYNIRANFSLDQVSNVLNNPGISSEDKFTQLLPADHNIDNVNDLILEIKILDDALERAKADFELAKHPSSSVVLYSRYAEMELGIKFILACHYNDSKHINKLRDSAEKHAKYLMMCVHWIAAEYEQSDENKASFDDTWKTPDSYTEMSEKLYNDLGIKVFKAIADKNEKSNLWDGMYLHHGDKMALRSGVVTNQYLNWVEKTKYDLKKITDVSLKECSGGSFNPTRLTQESKFICPEIILGIYGERTGILTSCSKVTLKFINKCFILAEDAGEVWQEATAGSNNLHCKTTAISALENSQFHHAELQKYLFQIEAKGKQCGEKIADRDSVIFKVAGENKVLSIKKVDLGTDVPVTSDEEAINKAQSVFRIFKADNVADPGQDGKNSFFNPGNHDPDNRKVSSAAQFSRNTVCFLVSMVFAFSFSFQIM